MKRLREAKSPNWVTYTDNLLQHKDRPVIWDSTHLTDKNTGFEQKQVSLLALSVPIRHSKPVLKNKFTHIRNCYSPWKIWPLKMTTLYWIKIWESNYLKTQCLILQEQNPTLHCYKILKTPKKFLVFLWFIVSSYCGYTSLKKTYTKLGDSTNRILKNLCMKVWPGFDWLQIKTYGWLFTYGNEQSGSIKDEKFLDYLCKS